MNKYIAKNDDGTINLYQVNDAIGLDFNPVQVVTLDEKNVDPKALNAQLLDLQARVDAVSLVYTEPAQESTGTEPTQKEDVSNN
jgi:hypothetical protein